MDFISGVIFAGIAFVFAVLFIFGIAAWRMERHHQQNKGPLRQGARLPVSAGIGLRARSMMSRESRC